MEIKREAGHSGDAQQAGMAYFLKDCATDKFTSSWPTLRPALLIAVNKCLRCTSHVAWPATSSHNCSSFFEHECCEHQSIKLPRDWSGSLHAYAICVAVASQGKVMYVQCTLLPHGWSVLLYAWTHDYATCSSPAISVAPSRWILLSPLHDPSHL